jgi:hypothetical protein
MLARSFVRIGLHVVRFCKYGGKARWLYRRRIFSLVELIPGMRSFLSDRSSSKLVAKLT